MMGLAVLEHAPLIGMFGKQHRVPVGTAQSHEGTALVKGYYKTR